MSASWHRVHAILKALAEAAAQPQPPRYIGLGALQPNNIPHLTALHEADHLTGAIALEDPANPRITFGEEHVASLGVPYRRLMTAARGVQRTVRHRQGISGLGILE